MVGSETKEMATSAATPIWGFSKLHFEQSTFLVKIFNWNAYSSNYLGIYHQL